MPDMKTFNGYEIVDSQARQDIAKIAQDVENIVIPEIPDKVSSFENDAGYLTEHQSLEDYATKEELNTAITNNKDVYYLDFTEVPENEFIEASQDAVEVIEKVLNNVQVAVYVRNSDESTCTYNEVTAIEIFDNHEQVLFVIRTPYAEDYSDDGSDGSHIKNIWYNFTKNNSIWSVTKYTHDSNTLATISYVDNKVESIEIPSIPSDISAFNNDVGYLTEHQSLEGYATESYVNTKYIQSDVKVDELRSDIAGSYATTQYVDEQIANVNSSGGVDLSNYYTKEETENTISAMMPTAVSNLENDAGYATEQYVDDECDRVSANIITLRDDIERDYASKTYVTEQIAGVNTGGSGDSVPYIDFYEIDVVNMAGLYLIDSSKNTLSVVRDSSRNITVNLSKWVSNGCVMVRDHKNVVAWGQDNDDVMFYVFSMDYYEDGSEITLEPSETMYSDGFVTKYATHTDVDAQLSSKLHYVDFNGATTEEQPATEEMIQVANYLLDGSGNHCVYVRTHFLTGSTIVPAVWERMGNNCYITNLPIPFYNVNSGGFSVHAYIARYGILFNEETGEYSYKIIHEMKSVLPNLEQVRTVANACISQSDRVLPEVTAEDEGKTLKVVNGQWTLV